LTVVGYEEGVVLEHLPMRSNHRFTVMPTQSQRLPRQRREAVFASVRIFPAPYRAAQRGRVGRAARKVRTTGNPGHDPGEMVRHDRSALETKCAASRGGTSTFYRD
jgi:hypothetical protein